MSSPDDCRTPKMDLVRRTPEHHSTVYTSLNNLDVQGSYRHEAGDRPGQKKTGW